MQRTWVDWTAKLGRLSTEASYHRGPSGCTWSTASYLGTYRINQSM